MPGLSQRFPRITSVSLATILCAFVASAAAAQAVVDPRYVQFAASADHYTTSTDNLPLVQGYQMAWYETGASTPSTVVNLGKPVPDGSGTILLDLYTYLSGAPTPGITYEARVVAVGPSGSAASGDSNAFTFSGPCTYQISPVTVSAAAAGGTGSLTVTTGTTCQWSATSQAPWLTVSVANGTGSSTVTLTIAANATAQSRTGTVTVAGATVTVTQAAAPCTFSVSPTSLALSAAGGTASATVTTLDGCSWTALTSTSWITLAATAGSSSQPVAYTVAPNSTTSTRTGTLNVAGQTITVTQAGLCSYTLNATSISVGSFSGAYTVGLSTGSSCAWTAVSSASWLTVNQASGTGAATVTYGVSRNTAAQRSATLTIGGKTLTVTQAAKATGKH